MAMEYEEGEQHRPDPEELISELQTLSARWGEVDVKRPLSTIDLHAAEPPHELPAPDEQDLRQREVTVLQRVHQAIEAGVFNGEQKERLIIALKEAERYFDDDRVINQLADLRDLLEYGPREMP